MNIEFKNASQLLENLINGKITFEDQKSSRFLVNAIGDHCASYCDRTFSDFSGCSDAWDISDHLNEMLPDWDYDWFDVLTFNFDIEEITHSLLINESIAFHYKFDVATVFVREHLSNWRASVNKFIAQTISDAVETR